MKTRTIAFMLALMSAGCVFTSCEKSDNSEKETSSKASQSEEKKEDKPEEKTAEITSESQEIPQNTLSVEKQEEVNDIAKLVPQVELSKNVYKTINTILTDMDCQDIDISGDYIISSDEGKNVNLGLSEEEYELFRKLFSEYMTDADNTDYFARIKDGSCVYAFAVTKGTDEGCNYPDGEPFSFSDEYSRIVNELE